MVFITLREKAILPSLNVFFHLSDDLSSFRWNCSYYPNIGKTLNSIDLVNLMSSISVRFNSFLFSYSIFNERKCPKGAVKSEEWKVKSVGWKSFAFSSFSFLFSLLSLLSPNSVWLWSVWMDSNHRPHAYQACALTTWATNRFSRSLGIGSSIALSFTSLSLLVKSEKWIVNSEEVIFPLGRLVEMMGIEPMTPCLQGRCSPSWATPPYHTGFFLKDH